MSYLEFELRGTLPEMVKDFSDATGTTFEEIGQAIGMSRTTISKYCSGTYSSNPTKIEVALTQYLSEKMGSEIKPETGEQSTKPTKKRAFFESRDAKNVIGVCHACQQEAGLGLVVGKSGFGKTYALKTYAKMPKVAYVECDAIMSVGDLLESIEEALGLPSRHINSRKRMKLISEFCKSNGGYLIIIDEADKLICKYSQKKMEVVRWIFDQNTEDNNEEREGVGIVVAGEPELEVILKNYDKRFAKRVEFYAMLKGLSKEEVNEYLEGYEIEEGAQQELQQRAYNKNNGCFRLFDRTLKNVFRILKQRGTEKITQDVLTQASDMMML